MHDIALLHKKLFRLGAYCFDDRLGEQFFLIEAADALVEVDRSCRVECDQLDAGPCGAWHSHGRPGMAGESRARYRRDGSSMRSLLRVGSVWSVYWGLAGVVAVRSSSETAHGCGARERYQP